MFFNSIEYAVFLPVVFFLYWFSAKKSYNLQNGLLVLASFVFYGWWDWRFLFLIIFSTVIDFSIGVALGRENYKIRRKVLLWISILVNLGILGIFKYYNWFLDSIYDVVPGLQVVLGFNALEIILPVGISFYTFQTLSYTIDVYKYKISPTKDIVAFSAFVTFFPQLVAGPIERASNLLPQFTKKRVFDYAQAVDGMRQILWGLFKKIVIADNCARYADLIFNGSADYGGSTLLLGALFFTFQIYGDFSGYSDIAIGTAKLFGINLMKNFAFPYFSRDIGEFWRRWHISLSTWFRDYLYIPMGGSRGGTWIKIRNIFVIFIVSGLWHGANWTFIIWGLLNALYFLPLMLTNSNRTNLGVVAQGNILPNLKEFLSILLTFSLTVVAWIFFRAQNLPHAMNYLSEIFSPGLFLMPNFPGMSGALTTSILIILFMIVEWWGREEDYAIAGVGLKWSSSFRYAFYYIIVFVIVWFGAQEQNFIYFQF